MGDDMSAYRDVFLSESAEYLQSIVDGLLALETNPGDLEPVEVVFRGAHSLKGMAAAMGYDATTELTHKMESLMDTVRKGDQEADADLIDLVLRAVDAVKDLIGAESENREPPGIEGLVAEIIARGECGPRTPEVEIDAEGEGPVSPPTRSADEDEPAYRIQVTLSDDCVLKSVRAYMVLKRLNYIGTVLDTDPSGQDLEDEKFDRTFSVVLRTGQGLGQIEESACHITDVDGVDIELIEVEEPKEEAGEDDTVRAPRDVAGPKLSDTQTVRVSISHLDTLVNLVGELVTVRSRLVRLADELQHQELNEAIEEMQRITSELQQEVMETRMVPVGNIFNRFPRMVRDLARDLGKEVALEMIGLEIELDRTVLDEIGDPIVHLLRNALDHGIESPDERVRAGKSERGNISLIARRERDLVQIVVIDDGRGMDVDRIWSVACERGVQSDDSRDTVSDEEILLLTCEPGFSTAKEATRVSGRGVGMDVVKGKIEYLGGSLSISSRPGEGSSFVLSLPLTLAIIQALLVRSHEYTFAIPLGAVSEVLAPNEMERDTVDGRPVVVLRGGEVVPLYYLDVLTGICEERSGDSEEHEHIILVESGEQLRALSVESLGGRQEIVIKPLSGVFKNLRGLAGATVLGDGSIALILDPRSFFSLGGV